MENGKETKVNTLNYWIDVESSTPPNIKTSNFTNKGDSKWNQMVSFSRQDELLWLSPLNEEIENSENWVHKVFLGIFNTKYVIKEFSSKEDLDELKQSHNTCLVSFLVDGKGVPIKNSLRVPDYLKSIALTTIPEKDSAERFELKLQDVFATWSQRIKNHQIETSYDDLSRFLSDIIHELKWELLITAYEESQFHSLAYTESVNLKTTKADSAMKFDTDDITSSLIVEDLKKVREQLSYGKTSAPLEKYLLEDFHSVPQNDVIKDKNILRDGLHLENMPMACWPFTGKYPLVSSQQYAVNNFFKEIDIESVLSVNGPPGTGKTTLLKDIVANIIFKRAEQLYQFRDNPQAAFSKMGETSLKANTKSIQEVFKMDRKLTGYEIVVTSSNNGAVENITKELPRINEIDESWHGEMEYLKEIATNINEKDSWGMISACLGNKKNNYNFFSKFLYSQVKTENNESTRSVFDFLSKPNYFMEKRVRWDEACINFEEKLKKVKSIKAKTMDAYKSEEKNKDDKDELLWLKSEFEKASKGYKVSCLEFKRETEFFNKNKSALKIKKINFEKAHKALNRPGLLADKKSLHRKESEAKTAFNDLKRVVVASQEKLKVKKIELNATAKKIKSLKTAFEKKKQELKKFSSFEKKFIKTPNQSLPFNNFWDQPYKKVQKSSPWHTKDLHNARVELFIASMDLHKAFIIENSKQIASNLNVFKQVLNGTFTESSSYSKAAWETLFLVVPIVSTTFSSFGNLFKEIGEDSIGWLLIDEAGQSTPQAPVGALWRSSRVLVVGDPLQVQPVIQIEDKLSNVLLEKNDTPQIWNSTSLSAQEIADRINPFGTNIDLGEKKWVGMPLRVHRRCDSPMFEISNRIAYDDLMIFGKPPKKEVIDVEKVLGKTKWINIEGEPQGSSHWVPAEGEQVVQMLKDVCLSESYEYGNKLPPIYIITPFKNIAFDLRRVLERRQDEWMPSSVPKQDLSGWLTKSVGTIHSFQGGETAIVFLVLGGNTSRPGAIKWVCEEPNILNVATTRAQKLFYIIGNKSIWNSGVFGLIREFIK